MKPRMSRLSALVLVLSLSATPLFAQQLEREPPPAGEPKPQPYLAGEPVDFRMVLAPPPAKGSVEDGADRQSVEALQKASEARRQSAALDEKFVYSRFDDVFGRAIDRKTSPVLVNLLNRAMRDVGAMAFPAKDYFQRPRPFQRIQLQRTCGSEPPPKPEANPVRGSSYPSGHSSGGWAVAMILARVAPERAEAIMSRATEYAESRVVCGRHFPSDVEAGHTVAAAVIARLDAAPEFQHDLAEARAELAR
jgi:acid phosphatase (class A)